MTEAATSQVEPTPFFSERRRRLAGRISTAAVVAVALVALSDVLFYRLQPGINLAIFFVALMIGSALLWPARLGRVSTIIAGAVAVAAIVPSVESSSIFSFLAALGGVAVFALAVSGRLPRTLVELPTTLLRFGVVAPFRSGADSLKFLGALRGEGLARGVLRTVVVWIIPAVFALVFLVLFASANPVIEWVLESIDLDFLLNLLNPGRVIFWLFMLSFVWPFLMPRLLRWRKSPPRPAAPVSAAENLIFGHAAILRSLALFNVLFAVQTALDIAYLWGGVALPDGMTYAAYAHRGAYPLIVTAVLAAAFVLAAMRRGGAGEKSQVIRILVYLWIAQNVWLVVSSILRLELYVESYSLTELRIAAGIWMGLVAIGLLLILARIALRKSNTWLVAMNLLALSLTLYGCAYVDFAALIARFNVETSLEVSGQGTPLDFAYLGGLGDSAIPALDAYIEAVPGPRADGFDPQTLRDELVYYVQFRQIDWRIWTFREQRIADYVAEHHPDPKPAPWSGSFMD